MIHLKQTQRAITFAKEPFKKQAQQILQYLDYPDFDLGIWLTTDKTVQKYNALYRNQDKPTDILSFPYHPELKAGKRIKVQEDEDKNIGDLIISVPYVFRNSKNLPGDFQTRMQRLLVHGICHCLGYDHIKDSDYRKMIALENKIIAHLQSL